MIISDFLLNWGWGLLAPVFALFLTQNIAGGDFRKGAEIAGGAALLYWVLKSIFQIPIGLWLDKTKGEKDDFYFMVLGDFLIGLCAFGYLFSSKVWHVYLLQALQAISMAMLVPSFSAVFTRHIDKGKEAFDWSIKSTSFGFAVGISGGIGGFLVSRFGFEIIFILVGIFSFLSSLSLFLIEEKIIPKEKLPPRLFDGRFFKFFH